MKLVTLLRLIIKRRKKKNKIYLLLEKNCSYEYNIIKLDPDIKVDLFYNIHQKK